MFRLWFKEMVNRQIQIRLFQVTNENNLSEIKENTLLELIGNEEMQYAI